MADFTAGTNEQLGGFDMVAGTWLKDIFVPQNLEQSQKNLEVSPSAY